MKTLVKVSALLALILALVLFTLATAQGAQAPTGTPVASGLNGPMGVMVDPQGNIWVVDSGVGGETQLEMPDPETGEMGTATLGDTARVVRVAPDGTQTDVAILPSMLMGQEASGGSRLAYLGGAVYATSGGWLEALGPDPMPNVAAIIKVGEGEATQIAETWSFEATNNPDGFIKESHPYGLAAGPDGMLYVADAGANTLLKLDPTTGEVSLVATFDGVPGPLPNPGRGNAMESDPVPTSVAFDSEGNAYVSLLPGFPFAPGSAKVVKVTPDGLVSDYATGLSMVTDLRMAPDGNLYAVQLGQFTEQGPVPGSGAVVRVTDGGPEPVLAGLSFPTSIDFSAKGDAYVTLNGVGAPGTGEVVRFDRLITRAGR